MTCASVRIRPSCATLASSALSRFFIVSRSWRCQTPRTPAGEIEWPSFLISLATRIWPKAGCSSENSTIRASISGAVRFAKIGFLRRISCNASSPPLFLEAVEAVAALAEHLAGLAHIAELPGELQQAHLSFDNLLVLGHRRCPHKTPRPGSPQPWPAPRPASALASAL